MHRYEVLQVGRSKLNIVPNVESELHTWEMLGVVSKKRVSLEIIRLLAELELASFVESKKKKEEPVGGRKTSISRTPPSGVFKPLPMFHL